MTAMTPSSSWAPRSSARKPRLITGPSTYVTDISLPAMHYVAFVQEPTPARQHPRHRHRSCPRVHGVRMVVTGEDIRKPAAPIPPAGSVGEGGASASEPGGSTTPSPWAASATRARRWRR